VPCAQSCSPIFASSKYDNIDLLGWWISGRREPWRRGQRLSRTSSGRSSDTDGRSKRWSHRSRCRRGAEKAEVWRNENYELKAKISGTIEGSHTDIYPSGEPGSLIPTFELKGSDEHDILDYEIGSCAVGKILSTMWKDEERHPPVAGYEAEILCSGARWNSRHVSASEAEWLSEWYLNGPRQPFIYGRGSITSLREMYERERKLPGNEKDSFEETKIIGGTGFVFVQTEELSFLVQHTPNDLGPSWSKCLSIEYRPTWGGIPEDKDREAIGALVGFLSGRELINLGHTRFDAEGRPISQVALSPRKDNLVSMCQRSGEFRPRGD
jgi:hypothetical protein